MSSSFQKWFYLLALSVIWGSSYILIKIGLKGFGYIESATIRLMAAALVFAPVAVYHVSKIPVRKFPLIALSGALGMLIPAYLFCFSQQCIPSSVAGVLIAMTPSFTFLISIFAFRKKYSITQITGLLLGLFCCIGLSMASSREGTLPLNIYILLIIVATLCYGANINLIKYSLGDIPALQLSSVSVLMNGLIAFIFVFVPRREHFHFSHIDLTPLLSLLALGIFGTALAQLFHNKLINRSSPLFASTSTYLIPVVAVLWGVADGEAFTWLNVGVIAGILFSVYLIRKEPNENAVAL